MGYVHVHESIIHLSCTSVQVRTIVDKSTKELSMEKTLKELDNTWSDMEFENELHTRTRLKLLKTNEELIETLEDNQVLYNTCTCSVFIYYFLGPTSKYDDF